jgi:ATP synthase F1 gamma subunit
MANKRELKDLFDQLGTLKTLTQTYQQIAANHIRKARTSVISNRDFITELLLLFQEVKLAYHEELSELAKRQKVADTTRFSLLKHNGKTTVVFIAANTGLYGSIVSKTERMLIEYLNRHEADVTIIGRLGESMFKQRLPEKAYTFFDFPDSKVDTEQMKKITQHLLQYRDVLVFYGQFQSIVSQNPTITSIDGATALEKVVAQPVIKYLFEPSVEKIVLFFEREIFGLFFEQTLRESQLAKHASRMYALDSAIQNINENLSKTNLKKRILHHRLINSKQQNNLIGISLWGRK